MNARLIDRYEEINKIFNEKSFDMSCVYSMLTASDMSKSHWSAFASVYKKTNIRTKTKNMALLEYIYNTSSSA